MACDGDGIDLVIQPNLETVPCEGCPECRPVPAADEEVTPDE